MEYYYRLQFLLLDFCNAIESEEDYIDIDVTAVSAVLIHIELLETVLSTNNIDENREINISQWKRIMQCIEIALLNSDTTEASSLLYELKVLTKVP